MHRYDLRRGLWLLAAALIVHAGFAAGDTAAQQRLDEIWKQAYGDTAGPAPGPQTGLPPVLQYLRMYGLLAAAGEISRGVPEAERLLAATETGEALTQTMAALEAESRRDAVTAAEGGIGGGNKGLGWYCNKVKELETALPQRVQALADVSADYVAQLRSIPVGRDDSKAQVEALTTRYQDGIRLWRVATQSTEQDIKEVSAGLGKTSITADTFLQLANAAASDARKLKTEAQTLDKVGSRFIPLIDPYLNGRNDLLRELPGLQLEPDYPADLNKRDALIEALQANPPPKTSAAEWKSNVDDTVAARTKAADEALARVAALTASISGEKSACNDKTDMANQFQALLGSTEQQVKSIEQSVSAALNDRLITITNLDKEHADIIATEKKTAEESGAWVKRAEEKYDNPAETKYYRNPQLYQEIVKQRERGAAAAESAGNLELARQGLQVEQQAVQRQATVTSGELSGQASFLYRW